MGNDIGAKNPSREGRNPVHPEGGPSRPRAQPEQSEDREAPFAGALSCPAVSWRLCLSVVVTPHGNRRTNRVCLCFQSAVNSRVSEEMPPAEGHSSNNKVSDFLFLSLFVCGGGGAGFPVWNLGPFARGQVLSD